MKIMTLSPSLMMENNRAYNDRATTFLMDYVPADKFVIYDQEFKETDYREGIEYIGLQKERQGFVKPRNALLDYFYKSDYDYAFLIGANSTISKSSLNDLHTLFHHLREGSFKPDAMFSTLGISVVANRILAKQQQDYDDFLYFSHQVPKNTYYLHGLIIKNHRKYYNLHLQIDGRCNPHVGTSEDVYLSMLLLRTFDCLSCPTLTVLKPPHKASTWMHKEKSYAYAPIDYDMLEHYLKDNETKSMRTDGFKSTIKLPRVEIYKQHMRPYRARRKPPAHSLIK